MDTQTALAHLDQDKVKAKDQELINTLVEVAADCPVESATIPAPKPSGETIVSAYYKLLSEAPYKLRYSDLFVEATAGLRGEDPASKNFLSYSIRRNNLCKKLGWGIHGDSQGRLALIPMESDRYRDLKANSAVRKVAAYRNKKA